MVLSGQFTAPVRGGGELLGGAVGGGGAQGGRKPAQRTTPADTLRGRWS